MDEQKQIKTLSFTRNLFKIQQNRFKKKELKNRYHDVNINKKVMHILISNKVDIREKIMNKEEHDITKDQSAMKM